MSANINVTLNGAVAQVINNVDSTTRVNSSLGNPTLPGNSAFYDNFSLILGGSGSSINIPTPAWVVYVKNLGGVNGTPSGNITVQMTVAGGSQISAANSPILPPGGVFIYWCTSESAGGISNLTLIASVVNTPCEILVAN